MSNIKSLFQRLKSWDTVAVLALACWPFIYFWPVAIGQSLFAGDDIVRMFLPVRLELARTLLEGRLPLWTPDMQAGFPLFAEGQVAALYPLHLILYRFLPIDWALSLSILFHLAWFSTGMYVFVRSMGCHNTSAMLAGLVVGFGGFTVAHIQHLTLLAVASWLPWLLFFQEKYWGASGFSSD